MFDTLRYTDYILNPEVVVLIAEVEGDEVGGFCCLERYKGGKRRRDGEVEYWGRCGESAVLQSMLIPFTLVFGDLVGLVVWCFRVRGAGGRG